MMDMGLVNGYVAMILLVVGPYVVLAYDNLIKKLIGLSLFQAAIFVLYISMGKITGGTAPILAEGMTRYSHPLPHVLILTAIVVGIATLALGLALVVRIHEEYDSSDEDKILQQEHSE